MNCNEAATLVARYVDGEVDDLQRRTIEQHLRTCANCVAEHQATLALRDRVRAEVPYHKAPPAPKLRQPRSPRARGRSLSGGAGS